MRTSIFTAIGLSFGLLTTTVLADTQKTEQPKHEEKKAAHEQVINFTVVMKDGKKTWTPDHQTVKAGQEVKILLEKKERHALMVQR